jgi:hypothetical protein
MALTEGCIYKRMKDTDDKLRVKISIELRPSEDITKVLKKIYTSNDFSFYFFLYTYIKWHGYLYK